MTHPPPDHPQVIVPAPVIYVSGIVLALLLDRLTPLTPLPEWLRVVGIGLLLISPVPGLWAVLVMWRARTGIEPHSPARQLVTSGPFRFSRNPIYLTMTVFVLGLGFFTRNLWMLPTLSLSLLIVHHGVIRREERYLLRKFGDAYTDYRQRVRRWL